MNNESKERIDEMLRPRVSQHEGAHEMLLNSSQLHGSALRGIIGLLIDKGVITLDEIAPFLNRD